MGDYSTLPAQVDKQILTRLCSETCSLVVNFNEQALGSIHTVTNRTNECLLQPNGFISTALIQTTPETQSQGVPKAILEAHEPLSVQTGCRLA